MSATSPWLATPDAPLSAASSSACNSSSAMSAMSATSATSPWLPTPEAAIACASSASCCASASCRSSITCPSVRLPSLAIHVEGAANASRSSASCSAASAASSDTLATSPVLEPDTEVRPTVPPASVLETPLVGPGSSGTAPASASRTSPSPGGCAWCACSTLPWTSPTSARVVTLPARIVTGDLSPPVVRLGVAACDMLYS
mmetsp:Transcript_22376/g.53117  ORF Transcript_22376/g.53117 Transcript_22376/m.53117 type:complete len:202 (-) Transcript_22376:16-621(-)